MRFVNLNEQELLIMATKGKAGKADRSTVSNEDHELKYAAKKLGVDVSVIKEAKKAVGNKREDIERHVKGLQGK